MAKRRVTVRVDRASLEAAKQILGTKTITTTVDLALDEILKRGSGQPIRRVVPRGSVS